LYDSVRNDHNKTFQLVSKLKGKSRFTINNCSDIK